MRVGLLKGVGLTEREPETALSASHSSEALRTVRIGFVRCEAGPAFDLEFERFLSADRRNSGSPGFVLEEGKGCIRKDVRLRPA